MDALALFKAKSKEFFDMNLNRENEAAIIFAACIIAETIGNRMDEFTRAANGDI